MEIFQPIGGHLGDFSSEYEGDKSFTPIILINETEFAIGVCVLFRKTSNEHYFRYSTLSKTKAVPYFENSLGYWLGMFHIICIFH